MASLSAMSPFWRLISLIWSSSVILARAALTAPSADTVWPSQAVASLAAAVSSSVSSPSFLPISASWAASSPTPKMSVRRSARFLRLLSMALPGAKTASSVALGRIYS